MDQVKTPQFWRQSLIFTFNWFLKTYIHIGMHAYIRSKEKLGAWEAYEKKSQKNVT